MEGEPGGSPPALGPVWRRRVRASRRPVGRGNPQVAGLPRRRWDWGSFSTELRPPRHCAGTVSSQSPALKCHPFLKSFPPEMSHPQGSGWARSGQTHLGDILEELERKRKVTQWLKMWPLSASLFLRCWTELWLPYPPQTLAVAKMSFHLSCGVRAQAQVVS